MQIMKHSLKQIIIRNLEKEVINATLRDPGKISEYRFHNFIAQIKNWRSFIKSCLSPEKRYKNNNHCIQNFKI